MELSKSNFDFVAIQWKEFYSGKLNDNSIDDNSGKIKTKKVFLELVSKTTAPVIKAIGYDYLYRMLVKLMEKRS